jgi:hypothetical protein
MRKTEASGWMTRRPKGALRRALQLSAITLGIGLVMTVGVARAQDDEDDDKTFEEKIIEGIMAGIGGTNMENRRWWCRPRWICRRRPVRRPR